MWDRTLGRVKLGSSCLGSHDLAVRCWVDLPSSESSTKSNQIWEQVRAVGLAMLWWCSSIASFGMAKFLPGIQIPNWFVCGWFLVSALPDPKPNSSNDQISTLVIDREPLLRYYLYSTYFLLTDVSHSTSTHPPSFLLDPLTKSTCCWLFCLKVQVLLRASCHSVFFSHFYLVHRLPFFFFFFIYFLKWFLFFPL